MEAAVVALEEASLYRHTRPGQSLVYLATMGTPVAMGQEAAAAKAAGLPPGWVPLLEMPRRAGWQRQQQTVAARVLTAFAPLALHVAALRNGRGTVAAAVAAAAEDGPVDAQADAGPGQGVADGVAM